MQQQKTVSKKILQSLLFVPIVFAFVFSANAQSQVNTPVPVSTDSLRKAKPDLDKPDKNGIYQIIDKMPQYPGGEKALLDYISRNVRYPIDAQEKGIQGKIAVRFIVSKFGKVEKAEILRGLYPSIDAEGLKVVNSLQEWIPGEQKGEKVSVYYTLPISFKLDGGTIVSSNLNNYAASAKFTTKTLHAGEGIPLYIVDGKEISVSDLNAIKTENIQTWNELKSETAIKVYGDKGKNGVVIITMKK